MLVRMPEKFSLKALADFAYDNGHEVVLMREQVCGEPCYLMRRRRGHKGPTESVDVNSLGNIPQSKEMEIKP